MQYMSEPIGTEFSNADLQTLATRFNQRADEGYHFHSVFQVTQPGGCLSGGQATTTYLAVYEKEDK
jgi:hypothetical protein